MLNNILHNKIILPDLKRLTKENNIKGISHLNKPEIIQRFIEYLIKLP